MSSVISNFLVRSTPKTFTDDTPNPGVMTPKGAQHVYLVDTNGNPITMAEDAAHTSGDLGVMALAVRYDDATSSAFPAALAGTTLDYSPLAVDLAGRPIMRLAVIGNAVIATDNGASSTGTQRVTVASDSKGAFNPKANAVVISQTTAVTIGGGAANDTRLLGITIHTALTGTCEIAGFADGAAAAQTYTLPAASVGRFDFFGAINSAGALTVTCSNAGDDNKVIVMWIAA